MHSILIWGLEIARLPLSNLFAVHDTDPAALEVFARNLQASGEFALASCVWLGSRAARLPRWNT